MVCKWGDVGRLIRSSTVGIKWEIMIAWTRVRALEPEKKYRNSVEILEIKSIGFTDRLDMVLLRTPCISSSKWLSGSVFSLWQMRAFQEEISKSSSSSKFHILQLKLLISAKWFWIPLSWSGPKQDFLSYLDISSYKI